MRYFRPLLPPLVFLALQLVAAGIVVLGGSLALALTVSSVATAAAVWPLGRSPERRDLRPWAPCLMMAAAGIVAGNLLSEQLALPDLMEEQFLALARQPLGFLALAVLGPVAEEVTFRRGVMAHIQRPWVAVVVSALLFGLVHGNPAQVPFAAWMGALLGVVYWRTGSIVLPIVIHVVNNTLAAMQMRAGMVDFSLTSWLGGPAVAWPIIVAGFGVSLWLMRRVCRRAGRTGLL